MTPVDSFVLADFLVSLLVHFFLYILHLTLLSSTFCVCVYPVYLYFCVRRRLMPNLNAAPKSGPIGPKLMGHGIYPLGRRTGLDINCIAVGYLTTTTTIYKVEQ